MRQKVKGREWMMVPLIFVKLNVKNLIFLEFWACYLVFSSSLIGALKRKKFVEIGIWDFWWNTKRRSPYDPWWSGMLCSFIQLLSHVQFFCKTMDCSLPGSSVHSNSQGGILEWVAISFPGDLPDPGIKPISLVFAGGFLPLSQQGSLNDRLLEKYSSRSVKNMLEQRQGKLTIWIRTF